MLKTAPAPAQSPAPAGRTALDVIRARGENQPPATEKAPREDGPVRPGAAPDVATARGWERPGSPTAPHDHHTVSLPDQPTAEARDLPGGASGLRESAPASHDTEPVAEEPAASPRSFGLVIGAVCGLIGLWPAWRTAGPPAVWALAAGVLLVALALLRPALLAGPARLWHRLGLALGWLNTRLLLGSAFLVLFVPLGLLRRLFGADPLQRARDPTAPTYRTPARPREPGHVRRQS